MFGSEAFLVDGNLACGASSRGFLVRVDRDEHDALLERPEATTMEMRGRGMIGWMRVDPRDLDDAQIADWVRRGLDVAATLPPK